MFWLLHVNSSSSARNRCSKYELHVGLDEAVERLSEQKVDASGMDSYTQEISKVCTQQSWVPTIHAVFFLLSVRVTLSLDL